MPNDLLLPLITAGTVLVFGTYAFFFIHAMQHIEDLRGVRGSRLGGRETSLPKLQTDTLLSDCAPRPKGRREDGMKEFFKKPMGELATFVVMGIVWIAMGVYSHDIGLGGISWVAFRT